MGVEEILLKEILDNQHTHNGKLDELKEDMGTLKSCVEQQEHKIMTAVRQEFVRKEDYPVLWKEQVKERRKDGMESFDKTTRFAANVWKWVSWVCGGAAAVAVGLGLDKILVQVMK